MEVKDMIRLWVERARTNYLGNDYLFGDSGSNLVFGGGGNTIYGGKGNDNLYGGPDNDALTGGAGYDFFDRGEEADIVADFNAQKDTVSPNSEVLL
jgi:Ca2+-binding RTX toxin-like protein